MKNIIITIFLFSFFFINPVFADYNTEDVWGNEDFELTTIFDNDYWHTNGVATPANVSTDVSKVGSKSLKMKCAGVSGCSLLLNGDVDPDPVDMVEVPKYFSFYFNMTEQGATSTWSNYIAFTGCNDVSCFGTDYLTWFRDSGSTYLGYGTSLTPSTLVFSGVATSTWYLVEVNFEPFQGEVRFRVDGASWSPYLPLSDRNGRLLRRLTFTGRDSSDSGAVYLDDVVFGSVPRSASLSMVYPDVGGFYKDFPNWVVSYEIENISSSTYQLAVSTYDSTLDNLIAYDIDFVPQFDDPVDWALAKTSLSFGDYQIYSNLIEDGIVIATSSFVSITITSDGIDYYTDFLATSTSPIADRSCSSYGFFSPVCLLFMPSDNILVKFAGLSSEVKAVPPFIWFYDISDYFVDVEYSSSTSQALLPTGTSFDAVFDMIKNMLSILLWIVFIFYISRRIIRFKF